MRKWQVSPQLPKNQNEQQYHMSLTTNAGFSIPTDNEVASFVFDEPDHTSAIEECLQARLDRIDGFTVKDSSQISRKKPPSPRPEEIRQLGTEAFEQVRQFLDPSFAVTPPEILNQREYLWRECAPYWAVPTISVGALLMTEKFSPLFALFVMVPGTTMAIVAASALTWLVARDVQHGAAFYTPQNDRMVICNFENPSNLRRTLLHENTHAIQTKSPVFGPVMSSQDSVTVIIEGQAYDVAFNLGKILGNKDTLEYQTLLEESVYLMALYERLSQQHERPLRASITDHATVVTNRRSSSTYWDRGGQIPLTGFAAFTIARHKGTLPSHREILDGNFEFIRP